MTNVTFCAMCNSEAGSACKFCSRLYCGNHSGFRSSPSRDVLNISDNRSGREEWLIRVAELFARVYEAPLMTIIVENRYSGDCLRGTYRTFFEADLARQVVEPRVESCAECSERARKEVRELNAPLSAGMQLAKRSRRMCSYGPCFLDSTATCGSCKGSFCQSHIARCWGRDQYNTFDCGVLACYTWIHKVGQDDSDKHAKGGCCSNHGHGMFSKSAWFRPIPYAPQ
jgi:hypothetical protein